MKNAPVILLFKSHIDTYTRKDGTVVQAHDDKRTKREEAQRAGNDGKDWRDEENWHSRMQGKMKTHSEAELRYIIKDAREAAKLAYERGNHKKGGQYEDEAHYAAQELHKRGEGVREAKRAYDNEKAEKPPGIWEDEKQRERMRDDAVRWANKEKDQYGSKWMRENLAGYFEERWHVPKKFTQPEIDKWFPAQ